MCQNYRKKKSFLNILFGNVLCDALPKVIARLCEAIQDLTSSCLCEESATKQSRTHHPPSLRGVRDEAIQDFLRKSIEIASIFFIEIKYRISWTATGFSRKKILRGDGERWAETSTHRNEFPRGNGREGSKFSVFARLCEAIQDFLRKSIEIASIFFIEIKYRISWTATGFSRKKILRGDGERWAETSTHRNEFPRGDGEEESKFFVFARSPYFLVFARSPRQSNPVRTSVFARSPRRLPGVFREANQCS